MPDELLDDKEKVVRVGQELIRICAEEGMTVVEIAALFGLLTRALINGAPKSLGDLEERMRDAFVRGVSQDAHLEVRVVGKGLH